MPRRHKEKNKMRGLTSLGSWLKRSLHSPKGPYPVIRVTRRNILNHFKIDFREATRLTPGERIKRNPSSNDKTVSIDLADLEANPLLLKMGLEISEYGIALYVTKQGNKRVVVVADTGRAIREDMPYPDVYVIEAGKYLSVGRSRKMDLTVAFNPSATVSGQHLSIFFPKNSEQVYLIDTSTNGTRPELLQESSDRSKYPDAVPKSIATYRI